jgi:uncharacterized membrane protein YkoI
MSLNRKYVAAGAAIAAIAAGGVAVATAVGGGDDDRPVTGSDADRAKAAALEATGGGTVSEIEYQDGDGSGLYEVEVTKPDGSQVEVHVNAGFNDVGTAADDDSGAEDEGEEGAEDD